MEKGQYVSGGKVVDVGSIPVPSLCMTCQRRPGNEVPCNLTRIDQAREIKRGEKVCCFAYEPNDPKIDKDSVLRELEEYLETKRSHHERMRAR
jgi:hypothetical protein